MTDPDRLLERVLQDAKLAAMPEAAALDRTFARIQRRLAAPDAAIAGPGAPAPVRALGTPRALELAKWLGWGALTGAVGFFLGVQQGRDVNDGTPPAPMVAAPAALVESALVAPAPAERAPEASRLVAATPEREAGVQGEGGGRALEGARRDRDGAGARSKAPVTPEPFGLEAVLERLARAQRAQRDGLAGDALALLDELDRRAPAAVLREERLVTRLLVACDLGDEAGAKRIALDLGEAMTSSIYASRLAESCAAEEHASPAGQRREL